MSIELCVLASGSSGNASLVRVDGRAMLIDAGLGPRSIVKRLDGTGVSAADLNAILLTHLDRDHFAPTWAPVIAERRLPVYCAQRHVAQLYRAIRTHGRVEPTQLRRQGLIRTFTGQPFPIDFGDHPPVVQPFHLAHDRSGTVGYVIRNTRHRLAYATDLGAVPEALLEAMADVDLLAIESNYDVAMEANSPRPLHLKQRVMSGHGHLSNDQALEAVQAVFARSARPPRHVVLLHLSRQCNCPKLLRRTYAPHADIAARLCLTSQHARTPWLHVDPAPRQALPGEQMGLAYA